MEVFKGYWRPLPAFDRLVWRINPDPSTRKNEFLTGGIDVLPFVTPEIVPEIQTNPNLRIETVLSTRLMFVGLPVDNPLLADKRVRLALNLAVNKLEIIEQLANCTNGYGHCHGVRFQTSIAYATKPIVHLAQLAS
jgi:ABC-type transport system substrate-binding protein